MKEKKIDLKESFSKKNDFNLNQELFLKFINLFKKKSLPQNIIIEGPKGSGKFNFVLNLIANFLNIENEDINLIQNNINNCCFILSQEDGNIIPVENVKKIQEFLLIQSDQPKFIIINSIDSFNKNGSNAILKSLEEPNSNCYFIILYNKNNELLETIRSRCISFKFRSDNFEEFEKSFNEDLKNTINSKDLNLLYNICRTKNNAENFLLLNGLDFFKKIEEEMLKNKPEKIDFLIREWISLNKKTYPLVEVRFFIVKIIEYFLEQIIKKDLDLSKKNLIIKEANELFDDINNQNIHLIFFYQICNLICRFYK